MKKNDVFVVEITDMGANAEGIGKVDGYALFVKDTFVGDRAKVKVTKVKKTYGYGRLMEIIRPSQGRVKEVVCPVARQCGGCQIQEMDYEWQLSYKQDKVKNHFKRIGGIASERLEKILEEPIPATKKVRYRNKAQFPVGRSKEGKIVAGFYAGRTHSIIPIRDCMIGVEENQEILDKILGFMERFQVPPYEEETQSGLIRHILIRKGFQTGDLMVCLVVNGDGIPKEQELISVLKRIRGMKSISISINKAHTNVIMGQKIHTLWGEKYIRDFIGQLEYRISPLSFFQVNPEQTLNLYNIVLDYADLTGEEVVWDLYCGIGTISLFLAQKAKKVFGVEVVPQAIQDARENAKQNGLSHVEFFVGKAEDVFPEVYGKRIDARGDVVVVDPPRKGCEESLLSTIVQMSPHRIVYVSCDSATLARDVKYLEEQGYELKKGRIVDQFCHSVHVECVALLTKK